MKKVFQIFFTLIASMNLLAQEKDFSSFIPKDYDTLQTATGDLNKDGIDDVVLALHPTWEDKDGWMEQDYEKMPKRLLIILLGTTNGYKQAIKTSNALLCKSCGGIFGDPFSEISIARNVLSISHYGGSAWRWSYNHKFRFQKDNWFLIGKTSNSYWNVKQCEKLDDFAGTDFEDVNLVTGQYVSKKITEDCVLKENKKGKKKLLPLVSLTKFKIDN